MRVAFNPAVLLPITGRRGFVMEIWEQPDDVRIAHASWNEDEQVQQQQQ